MGHLFDHVELDRWWGFPAAEAGRNHQRHRARRHQGGDGAPPTNGEPPQYTLLQTAEAGEIKARYDRSTVDLGSASVTYDDVQIRLTCEVAVEIPSDGESDYLVNGAVKRVFIVSFTRDDRAMCNALVDLELGDGRGRLTVISVSIDDTCTASIP